MDNYQPGDQLYMRFGSFGAQLVEVVKDYGVHGVQVKKYRANSKRWTQPQIVNRGLLFNSKWAAKQPLAST